MSKIKAKRVGFRLDMTPMVDVAFLLLTFFMLTTKFRPPEAVKIDLPSSHSNMKLPESDVLTVTVSKDNTFLMGVSSQRTRARLFDTVVKKNLENAGLPAPAIADSLKKFRLDDSFRITREELPRYIIMSRMADQRLRPVIRADNKADYESVNYVIKVFKKLNMLNFNLVTVMEREVR
ncbi:MAG TPA: biopolymer transporter ExbD [Chlorobaculum sp.]|jgi:biopolymer transport protein ExbD|nr:biopolymer transporter ExbD [Chlorobaculum sp.]